MSQSQQGEFPPGIPGTSSEGSSGGSIRPRVRPEHHAQIVTEKANETSTICHEAPPEPEVAIEDEEQIDADVKEMVFSSNESLNLASLVHSNSLFPGEEISDKNIAGVKFADEIKIDFINSIDYRILCRFLGLTQVNDVKNHPYQGIPLLVLMTMQCIKPFMVDKGYSYAGELNFDREGNSRPTLKTVWRLKGKDISFVNTGFLYFEKKDQKDKKQNVVFFVYTSIENGTCGITCYTTGRKYSENIMEGLEKYTKKNNCLRGNKFKDIMLYLGEFTSLENMPEFNWENYYFPEELKDLFELEIFGFLKEVKKYNDHGINKRGLILYGRPGCVIRGTKINIRKKKKEGKHQIIEK